MDRKLKHLDFVQGVINRLSTNSFLLKGWSVIIISALLALSAERSKVHFAVLAYLPALVFWGLDGYFLALERTYRRHYERVRSKQPDEIDFSMDISDVTGGFKEWLSATFSKTLIPFHGALLGAILLLVFVQL